MIVPSSQITLSPDVLFQELDNEAVMLHMGSEIYFGLDDVGLRIWQLLEQFGNVGTVVAQMMAEYDVPEEQLRQDINDLLTQLAEAGLVSVETP